MDGTIRVRTVVGYSAAVFAGMIAALVILWAMRADAAPGDSGATFVAIAPCRLADTRPQPDRVGAAGTFGADQTVTFASHGTNGQCTIPADAVGLSLNVTAVGATAPTYVTVWGDGDRPLASSLNPAPGQPPTPNAVATPLSGSGSFQVYNLGGSLDLIIDVNGFYTKTSLQDLDARVAALEIAGTPQAVLDRLAALEAKLASMSVVTVGGQPTVRFSGVNVQVVNGAGSTETVNGRGNLIVGYHEDTGEAEARTGSHNIVVGLDNDYTAVGGMVAGRDNTIAGDFATVTGGQNNTVAGTYGSVSGGRYNVVRGESASVSGGNFNWADGYWSAVSGGSSNVATGDWSSVSGGYDNEATGLRASVSGGDSNTAAGSRSSVSGGYNNTATGTFSSVSGGGYNDADGLTSSVSGGLSNTTTGSHASVSGGQQGTASGSHSSVSGGYLNAAGEENSSVSGGISNESNGLYSSVSGGADNVASGTSSSVSGGYNHTASGIDDWRAGGLFQDF